MRMWRPAPQDDLPSFFRERAKVSGRKRGSVPQCRASVWLSS